MQVSTDPILDAFDGPLLLIDDDAERERITTVIRASRPAVENAVNRVFSEALSHVNEGLDGARVELRLVEDGIDVEVVEEAETSTLESDFTLSPGDVEKLTLRIIEPLKKAAAKAAAEEVARSTTGLARRWRATSSGVRGRAGTRCGAPPAKRDARPAARGRGKTDDRDVD